MGEGEGEEGELPKFCYANKAALALFESSWDEFVGMESRRTAEDEAEVQRERDAYLSEAMAEGHVEGLEVWRISQKGTRFLLKDVVLWNGIVSMFEPANRHRPSNF